MSEVKEETVKDEVNVEMHYTREERLTVTVEGLSPELYDELKELLDEQVNDGHELDVGPPYIIERFKQNRDIGDAGIHYTHGKSTDDGDYKFEEVGL